MIAKIKRLERTRSSEAECHHRDHIYCVSGKRFHGWNGANKFAVYIENEVMFL